MRVFLMLLAIAPLTLAVSLGGCGGDESEPRTTAQSEEHAQQQTSPATVEEDTQGKRTATSPPGQTQVSPDSPNTSGTAPPGVENTEATERDRRAALAVAHAYYKALSRGDGARACSLLSAPTRKQVAKVDPGDDSCAETVSKSSQGYSEQLRTDMANVEVQHARLRGAKGVVFYKLGSMPRAELPVRREAAGWRIFSGG